MSSDDEIREDDDEEVIEVITHEDDAEDGGDALSASGRGVDIIGERPIRRSPPQQPPGCLYSFLLFLVGIGVGWIAYWTYTLPVSGAQEDRQEAIADQIVRTKKEITKLAEQDIAAATELATARNYGDACQVLERVASYYSIQKRIDPTVPIPNDPIVRDIIAKMSSDEAAVQEEGRSMLRDLAGGIEGAEVAPESGESAAAESAESATPESGAAESAESGAAEPAAAESAPAAAAESAAAPAEEAAKPADEKPAEEKPAEEGKDAPTA